MSGIQPASHFHLGHYFGALKHHISLHRQYPGDCFFMIADYHALTRGALEHKLRSNTLELARLYLAFGLDPEAAVMYRQSDVPQVTELAWILGCFTSIQELSRNPAFKTAQERVSSASDWANNLGLLSYPVLMAADILSLRATMVPVGKDQLPNIDRVRDIAQRFNSRSGKEVFPLPMPIPTGKEVIRGNDGRKMMGDYNNTIPLFIRYGQLKAAVDRIQTDSKGPRDKKDPDTCPVYGLLRFVCPPQVLADLKRRYESSGPEAISYAEAKDTLMHHVQSYFAPFEERYHKLGEDTDFLWDVLKSGIQRAAPEVDGTVDHVRHVCGILS